MRYSTINRLLKSATIELVGATDAADIKTLEGYDYISTVDGSNLDEINGSTEDITDALTALTNESSIGIQLSRYNR